MAFDALEISIELARSLRAPLAQLRQRDRSLADQAYRAANGIALQLAEGHRRAGADRLHLFRIASGSAEELSTALRLAEAWGFLDESTLAPVRELLARELAMLWKLTH